MIRQRGRADYLSSEQSNAFFAELEMYVLEHRDTVETLWRFGSYEGDSGSCTTEKMAPHLQDLLLNSRLWILLLGFFIHGKMRDIYFQKALSTLVIKYPWVNNTGNSVDVFCLFLRRVVHTQVSHLRSLKMYPERYEYRMNQLSASEMQTLNRILTKIVVDKPTTNTTLASRQNCSSSSSTPSSHGGKEAPKTDPPMPKIDSVFKMFSVDGTGSRSLSDSMTSSKPSGAAMDTVFDMFLTTPTKKQKRSVCDDMMTTPPPPATRGGIKAKCHAQASTSSGPASRGSGLKLSIMRAQQVGRRRTCLRVTTMDDTVSRSWAEISENQSRNHSSLIEQLYQAVKSGSVTSKEEAQKMKQRLLASE